MALIVTMPTVPTLAVGDTLSLAAPTVVGGSGNYTYRLLNAISQKPVAPGNGFTFSAGAFSGSATTRQGLFGVVVEVRDTATGQVAQSAPFSIAVTPPGSYNLPAPLGTGTSNITGAQSGASFGPSTGAGVVLSTLADPYAGKGFGTTTFSTFATPPAQLAISGNTIVTTSTPPVAGTPYKIRVLATSGDGDSEVGTSFTFTATASGGSASLGALTLSSTTFSTGGATSVGINGKTAGSTITATSSDGTALTVSGSTLTGTFTTAGSPTITLVETLSGATGSPRTSTVTVTVTAASSVRFAIDSANASWPQVQDANPVIASTQFGASRADFPMRACTTGGYFMLADRYLSGSTQDTAVAMNGTAKTLLRAEMVNIGTGVTYPLLHPDNGSPITDSNQYSWAANAPIALKHGPCPAGTYTAFVWDNVPIGGRRTATCGPVKGTKVSGTAFHTAADATAKPTIGAFASYQVTCFWFHVGDSAGIANVVFGDSIEDNLGYNVNGWVSDGPLRSMLNDSTIGNGSVPTVGCVRAGSGMTAVTAATPVSTDVLSTWEAFGALIGQTDRWLFRQVTIQHWRNSATGMKTFLPQALNRIRAKDPNVQAWAVLPDPYVAGPASGNTGADFTLSTDYYTTVGNQVPCVNNSVQAARDDYIAWISGTGTYAGQGFAGGILQGVFDHVTEMYSGLSNPRVFKVPAGASGATVADYASGAATIKTNFKPEGNGYAYALNPGQSPQNYIEVSSSVDNGDGTFTWNLSTKANNAYTAGAVVKPAATPDGTHCSRRLREEKRVTNGWITGKNSIISRAASYAG